MIGRGQSQVESQEVDQIHGSIKNRDREVVIGLEIATARNDERKQKKEKTTDVLDIEQRLIVLKKSRSANRIRTLSGESAKRLKKYQERSRPAPQITIIRLKS